MVLTQTCPQCGTIFPARSNKTYCHPRCRQRAFHQPAPDSAIAGLPHVPTVINTAKAAPQWSEAKQRELDEADRKRRLEEAQEKVRQTEMARIRQQQELLLVNEYFKQLAAQQSSSEPVKIDTKSEAEIAASAIDDAFSNPGSWLGWVAAGLGFMVLVSSGNKNAKK